MNVNAKRSGEFCGHCFIEVPTANKKYYNDVSGREVVFHNGCRDEYERNEIKRILISITKDLHTICAESIDFVKKTKKEVKTATLQRIKEIFHETILWIQERIGCVRQCAAHLLDSLYRKINYLAKRLGFGDEIIFFSTSPIH